MRELILAVLRFLKAEGVEAQISSLYEEGHRCLIIVFPKISPDVMEKNDRRKAG